MTKYGEPWTAYSKDRESFFIGEYELIRLVHGGNHKADLMFHSDAQRREQLVDRIVLCINLLAPFEDSELQALTNNPSLRARLTHAITEALQQQTPIQT